MNGCKEGNTRFEDIFKYLKSFKDSEANQKKV